MGFVIWYKIEFLRGRLGAVPIITVSNDVYSGQYIVDANIILTMQAGPEASSFEVKLTNLPQDAANLLKSQQASSKISDPLQIKIYLGYFEDLPGFTAKEVMIGAVTSLKNAVNHEGLMETSLKGQELGGYRLRTKQQLKYSYRDTASVASVLESILENTEVSLNNRHGITSDDTVRNFTLKGHNALTALEELADQKNWPVIIRDNEVLIKNSVGAEAPIDTLTPDTNIVALDDRLESEELLPRDGQDLTEKIKTIARSGLSVKALGNPKLRVGQPLMIRLQGEVTPIKYFIHQVVHRFSSASGYTCDLILVITDIGEKPQATNGARAVKRRIKDLARATQRPAIDIGQINAYEAGNQQKHLVTLDYGQSPPADKMAPSVETPVDETVQLHSKPIASPFAWHKCGLVVPVYPKMRALLAHNRGSVNDAVVTGFLWAENLRYEPPKNEPGDYWLCLPTGVKPDDEQPKGKGVNDLTDKDGRRVIQTKGLHILVGSESLPPVGERPKVPDDLDDTIVIEHQSGTKITITADGAVKIETDNQDISLSNGGVTLSLSGSAVNVS